MNSSPSQSPSTRARPIVALTAIATFLFCCSGGIAADQKPGAPDPAATPAPIVGTISSCYAMLGNAIGTTQNTPARFEGIVFELEGDDMSYVFKSPTFQHKGRNLLDNLKGARVRIECVPEGDDPSQVERQVRTLDWLPASDAKPGESPAQSRGAAILRDPAFFKPEFAQQVDAAAPGEGLAVPAPCPELAKVQEKYGRADRVKLETVKVKDGPTVMLAVHHYGDHGFGVANDLIMAVLKNP